MLFKETERFLKRILKKKYKYTKMLLITFLMTGGLGMAAPITPNANGEYIVNSGTGDGEILNFSNSYNSHGAFRISEGKKFTLKGYGDIDATTQAPLFTPRTAITVTNSNTEFEATGTGVGGDSVEISILPSKEAILYTVTDPITGVSSSAINQKVTLKDVFIWAPRNSTESTVKVEAKNGKSIKNAELNLIGSNGFKSQIH